MRKVVENDGELQKEETFKAMIKAFTTQTLYSRMGQIMFNGRYSKLQLYLKTVMGLNTIYGMKYSYKGYEQPLYRGMGVNGRF
jgi:hypothetical protein